MTFFLSDANIAADTGMQFYQAFPTTIIISSKIPNICFVTFVLVISYWNIFAAVGSANAAGYSITPGSTCKIYHFIY